MSYDRNAAMRLCSEAREAAGNPQRIVATVNLRDMADQLEAAAIEIDRLISEGKP